MAWPETRLSTPVASDPIKSAEHVLVQDAIIAGQHGDVIDQLTPHLIVPGSWSQNTNGYILSGGGGVQGNVWLPWRKGERVKSISFKVWGDGAADLDWALHKLDAAMNDSIVGALQTVTNPAAAWNTATYDVPDTTLADFETFFLAFTANAANIRVGNIKVTKSRP